MVIEAVKTKEVDIGIKRSATLSLTITEELLMVMGEVYIVLIPVTLPHITQVVIREEVDLYLKIPATIPLLIM